jgi:hypothetical protein
MPGTIGPDNCGLAYLVATDPELRDMLAQLRKPRCVADPGTTPRDDQVSSTPRQGVLRSRERLATTVLAVRPS